VLLQFDNLLPRGAERIAQPRHLALAPAVDDFPRRRIVIRTVNEGGSMGDTGRNPDSMESPLSLHRILKG
jgi:hypothetical protein